MEHCDKTLCQKCGQNIIEFESSDGDRKLDLEGQVRYQNKASAVR